MINASSMKLRELAVKLSYEKTIRFWWINCMSDLTPKLGYNSNHVATSMTRVWC